MGQGWADEQVAQLQRRYPNANMLDIAAKASVHEHARAVRIVTRSIKSEAKLRVLAHQAGLASHRELHVEVERALQQILAALTKGRGKGGGR